MTLKVINLYSGNKFDPDQLARDGFSGVIFKLGQGEKKDLPDGWWDRAGAAGLKRGGFWIKDARIRVSYEVEAWKRTVGELGCGDLGIWVDAEKPYTTCTDEAYLAMPYRGWHYLYDFCYALQQTGYSKFAEGLPGMYTSPGAWKLICLPSIPVASQAWFGKMLLWTAQYPLIYAEGKSKPLLYGAWNKWTLWQWRQGPDYNIFNGSDAEFATLFPNVVVSVPPAPTPITMTLEERVTALEKDVAMIKRVTLQS